MQVELLKLTQTLTSLPQPFPRAVVQVELLKLLHDKMADLSRSAERMPRPHFRMCILYVDEHESIQRQLSRGRAALEHNRLVAESGEGEPAEGEAPAKRPRRAVRGARNPVL